MLFSESLVTLDLQVFHLAREMLAMKVHEVWCGCYTPCNVRLQKTNI